MALRKLLQSLRANFSQQTDRKPRTRLGLQRLEDRAVPAAGFLSAFSPGSATGASDARDIAVDAAGNSYLTGYFSETVDFDPSDPADAADTLTAHGSGDAFVAKYTANDTLLWVRRMGGDAVQIGASDIGTKIAIDAGGNVYVTGRFKESADFGPYSLNANALHDGFVMKLNASGDVSWAESWGAGNNDTGLGIGVDSAGNVYALSVRTDAAGLYNSPNNGHDVLKFSSTGAPAWTRSVATQRLNSSGDMAVDAAGNVYLVGTFTGSVDFDPGSKTKFLYTGSSDAFVLKLTSAGNYGWVTPFFSNSGASCAQSVALDGTGSVTVGGYYSGTVDFNPSSGTTTLPAGGGGFITKLSNSGALTWVKALASTSTTFVYGLAVDAVGSIYATGTFYGTVDFDPGAGTHIRTTSGSDVFALKLNAAGVFQWAETIGGSGSNIGWAVAVSSTGVVHLTGNFMGAIDFDPDSLVNFELIAPRRSSFFSSCNSYDQNQYGPGNIQGINLVLLIEA